MLEVNFRSVFYSFHHLILTDSLQALSLFVLEEQSPLPALCHKAKSLHELKQSVFLRNPTCWHAMQNTVTASN